MPARGGQVGEVGAEVEAAAGAVVPGVGDAQHPGSVAQGAAEVVQGAVGPSMAVTGTPTARAAPAAIVTRPLPDERRGEILDTRDPLGAIRDILAGSGCHDRLLHQLERATTGESRDGKKSTRNPLSLLQSRFFAPLPGRSRILPLQRLLATTHSPCLCPSVPPDDNSSNSSQLVAFNSRLLSCSSRAR